MMPTWSNSRQGMRFLVIMYSTCLAMASSDKGGKYDRVSNLVLLYGFHTCHQNHSHFNSKTKVNGLFRSGHSLNYLLHNQPNCDQVAEHLLSCPATADGRNRVQCRRTFPLVAVDTCM